MANAKVLIIDDEVAIINLVSAYLKPEGYEVYTATEGPSGLQAARAYKPDLIVLDVMLPGMDGVEVLTRLRRESDVYVILLTAKTEETDKIVGLSVGADDYVTKPFSPREVVARVKAVLRRGQTPPAAAVLRVGALTLDRERREVALRGVPVELTPTEFELLATLMAAPGRVFSRAALLEAAQGVAFEAYERTVDAHIKNLRRKIEPDPADPQYIVTVRGAGYRLEEPETP